MPDTPNIQSPSFEREGGLTPPETEVPKNQPAVETPEAPQEPETVADLAVNDAEAQYNQLAAEQDQGLERVDRAGDSLGLDKQAVQQQKQDKVAGPLQAFKTTAWQLFNTFKTTVKNTLAIGMGAATMTAAADQRRMPEYEHIQSETTIEQVANQKPEIMSAASPITPVEEANSVEMQIEAGVLKSAEDVAKTELPQTQGTERTHPPLAKDNPQRQYLSSKESYLEEVVRKENEVRQSRVESIKFALNQAEQNRQAAHDAGDRKEELEAVRELVQFQQRLEEEQRPLTAKDFEKFDPKTKERAQADLARVPDEAADAYQKYDAQREWLAGVVHSPAYEVKAVRNEGLSPEENARRKEASLRDEISLNDQFHSTGQDNLGVRDPYSRRNRITARFGKIPPEKAQSYKESYPGAERYQDVPVAVHEMEHEVTEGERGMSETAKRLYKEAYTGVGSDTKIGAYLSKPEEMDARKRVFEYELERHGIWKYGDLFTQEHLQKALELRKAGKLTDDSQVFLDLLKPEKIPEIMNTIADSRKPDASGHGKAEV